MIRISRIAPKALWLCSGGAFILALLYFPVWRKNWELQLASAAFFTFLSWFWMTIIFISAFLLWRGKEGRFLGLASYIVFFSTALSGFWLMVFYPAVMSVDAFGHWQAASNNQYSSWHPPLLAMLMHVTQHFVKTPSLFSFIQGSLFWGAILFLVRQVAKNQRSFLVDSAIIILLPPLWLYSNATVSNTWMATFAMFSMAWLIRSIKGRKTLDFFLSVLSFSIAVMFRAEVILCVIVPIVVYLFWLKLKASPIEKAITISIIIALSIAPSKLIELSPRVVQRPGPQVHGLFNQYVGTIVNSRHRMTSSELRDEEKSINSAFGNGVFQKLIEGYNCRSGDYIIMSRRRIPPVLRRITKEKVGFIVKKVVLTAFRHPLGYLKHQLCYFGQLSQFSEIGYQTWGVIKPEPRYDAIRASFGFDFKSRLPSVRAGYIKLMNASLRSPLFSLPYRHYIFLFFSTIFLGVGIKTRRIEWVVPSLFSLIYPLGYLLAGTAGLWRYLLISYLGSWVCLLSAMNDLFGLIKKAVSGSHLFRTR
jgi:hypothetical protein